MTLASFMTTKSALFTDSFGYSLGLGLGLGMGMGISLGQRAGFVVSNNAGSSRRRLTKSSPLGAGATGCRGGSSSPCSSSCMTRARSFFLVLEVILDVVRRRLRLPVGLA